MPLVSIIIVNYNSSEDVLACLESIARWTDGRSFEVIVVDNASSECDFSRLRAGGSDFTLVRNDRNLGFGAANNRGSVIAKGDYLLFLNPDTVLLNDAVGAFLEFMQSPDGLRAGVAGCWLLDTSGNANHSYGDFEDMRISVFLRRQLLRVFRNIYHALLPRRRPEPRRSAGWLRSQTKVDWITGADLFVRKAAFLDVGGFDERIFLYAEDVDLQRRLRGRGWERWVISGPRIVHTHGRDDRAGNSTRILFWEGNFTYFGIYYPRWIVHAAFLIFKACCGCNALVDLRKREYSTTENFDFLRRLHVSNALCRANGPRSVVPRNGPLGEQIAHV